jgi:hypothetical protein
MPYLFIRKSRDDPDSEADRGSDAKMSSVDAGLAALDRLRGLMRDEFAAYGGGEAFLKWLRTDPELKKQDEL